MNTEDLGRRAVACKHWRWMPGMRIMDSGEERYRIVWVFGDWMYCDNDVRFYPPYADITPDLTDPATLGCLLHLVREAWGYVEHSYTWEPSDNDPYWTVWCGATYFEGHTEVEALVAALEAADGNT